MAGKGYSIMIELKPRPFCGGKAEFANGGYWGRELFKVKCSNKDKCVMLPETGVYFIKQQAAEVWNTRSDNA